MHTQKVAITLPKDLLEMVDDLSKKEGLSRSKCISAILRKQMTTEKNKEIKAAYDRIFSDNSIRCEQKTSAEWFDRAGLDQGQEW